MQLIGTRLGEDLGLDACNLTLVITKRLFWFTLDCKRHLLLHINGSAHDFVSITIHDNMNSL